ncbi:DUF2842 domain-containing protein [Phenylobacterium montanum]|nr:DUF2842 domain-containing protein [Caulobacter sp. S6]
MNARTRKLIGGLGILVFLAAYVIAVVNLADHLPDNQLIKLAYYVLSGTLWGAPLIPLITWMNRGR